MTEGALQLKPKLKENQEDLQGVIEQEYKQMVAFLDEKTVEALYQTRDKAVAEGVLEEYLQALNQIDAMVPILICDEYLDPQTDTLTKAGVLTEILDVIEDTQKGESTEEFQARWETREPADIFQDLSEHFKNDIFLRRVKKSVQTLVGTIIGSMHPEPPKQPQAAAA